MVKLLMLAALALASPTIAQDGVIRSIKLEGARALPAADLLGAVRGLAEGKSDNEEVRRAVAGAVERLYAQKGFTLARVAAMELSADGVWTVSVAEGSVREVRFRGNRRTSSRVLRSALSLRPGDVYNEAALREDRARLARLGIFEDIQIVAVAPGAPEPGDGSEEAPPSTAPPSDDLGRFDLVVRVKERQTGNVAATVGYADRSGLVGFLDLSEQNLLGEAQQVSIQWQRIANSFLLNDGTFFNERPRQAFEFSLARPALGRRDLSVGLSVYDQNTVFLPFFGNNQETLRSYEKRLGGRVQVGRNLSGRLSGFVSLRRDTVGYDQPPPELLLGTTDAERATALVGAWGLGLQADGRDAADNPRQGFLHRLSVERAGGLFGGQRNFTQVQLDLRQYAPLGAQKASPTLALRLLGGTTSGAAPLPEQFFLGGFELLRGYDLFSIRGERMVLGSAEVRFPLGTGLTGVVFSDVGNAWRAGQRSGGLKASGGAGLRFASPLGPLRLDMAYGDRFQTYFTLGQSF